MARPIRVRAFAKINLSLHVVGVRSDGYHELRTEFMAIALFDTLTVRARPGPLELTCDDPACPTDDTNLVSRAAAAVWKAAGRRGAPHGVAVHLDKGIPIQAGLGGGSSDAAAALRLFARIWRVPARRLGRLARRLGADVPYFLVGGTAVGSSRGDRLEPLADPPQGPLVIVVPRFRVSTKEAFEWWDRDRPRHRDGENDLQGPVARRHPEIARIVTELRRHGAWHAAMSGSGSAVFGLFKSRAAAQRAAKGLRTRDRRVEVTHTLTRRECRVLAAK